MPPPLKPVIVPPFTVISLCPKFEEDSLVSKLNTTELLFTVEPSEITVEEITIVGGVPSYVQLN